MKINVDPNTDVGGFGYAKAGQHRLRVVEVEYKEGQKAPYLAWKLEFADPNTPSAEKKEDGSNKNLGNIFENTTLSTANNGQFRLRQLCDAAGIAWSSEIDTDDLIGLELEAHVGIKEYNGTLSNEVKKFVPAG
jgi:hypothetical protein